MSTKRTSRKAERREAGSVRLDLWLPRETAFVLRQLQAQAMDLGESADRTSVIVKLIEEAKP